jgi:hypothetical protein
MRLLSGSITSIQHQNANRVSRKERNWKHMVQDKDLKQTLGEETKLS